MTAPAKSPCGSCPYRKDVPAGLWHPEEYAKLPRYDLDTPEQPPNVFMCHQQNGAICSGWAGCHDMDESLAIRMAFLTGNLTDEEVDQVVDYVSPVPLFSSGREAADHGLSGVEDPDHRARKAIDKLTRKIGARG